MNNWNYTEYIPVVPYYLITMSKYTMTYTTSGQDCLLFPILIVRTMNLTNQRMFCIDGYELFVLNFFLKNSPLKVIFNNKRN